MLQKVTAERRLSHMLSLQIPKLILKIVKVVDFHKIYNFQKTLRPLQVNNIHSFVSWYTKKYDMEKNMKYCSRLNWWNMKKEKHWVGTILPSTKN